MDKEELEKKMSKQKKIALATSIAASLAASATTVGCIEAASVVGYSLREPKEVYEILHELTGTPYIPANESRPAVYGPATTPTEQHVAGFDE